MTTCRKCHHEHRHEADRMACDAIHGYVMRWPEVADPLAMCELCGSTDALSMLLEHFAVFHGREDAGTGALVRFIRDTPDVARYTP